MIYLGPFRDNEKRELIAGYVSAHGLRHVKVISADQWTLPVPGSDQVPYSQVIMYRTFYRLLQEITDDTLLVLHECLRTQNRYDLAYNCIRNYLTRTTHQIIFSRLPQIDTAEDFMILFDWDTRSRWKRNAFDPDLVRRESQVIVRPLPVSFTRIDVPTRTRTRERYAAERERLFRELGARDPHTIPRNLHLLGGPDKQAWIDSQALPLLTDGRKKYVGRNSRLRGVIPYKDARPGSTYTCVELPHRFIDFADFLCRTGQVEVPVLVADLKVDHWYFDRYTAWARRLHDTYAALQ